MVAVPSHYESFGMAVFEGVRAYQTDDATVERARTFMEQHGADFFTALWATRAGNVFAFRPE